mgnify:CR=1 FL=1
MYVHRGSSEWRNNHFSCRERPHPMNVNTKVNIEDKKDVQIGLIGGGYNIKHVLKIVVLQSSPVLDGKVHFRRILFLFEYVY